MVRVLIFVAASLCSLGFAAQSPACSVLDVALRGTYEGGCINGLADGYGVARGLAQFQGEFRSGRPHGRGLLLLPNGDRYEGEFSEGRPSGAGIFVWSPSGPRTGEQYEGQFRDGLAHGLGTKTWGNRERYSGEWLAGRPLGPFTASMVRREAERAELAAAMGTPGSKVCRQVGVGIAVRYWISGRVLGLIGEKLRVRLDDPGTQNLTLNGVAISSGLEAEDDYLSWIPCR